MIVRTTWIPAVGCVSPMLFCNVTFLFHHQKVDFISLPLESELDLKLILTNRIRWKQYCVISGPGHQDIAT